MFKSAFKSAAVLTIALGATTALAMPVQIDFSAGNVVVAPGYRLSDTGAPGFDNRLDIGSRLPNNADNLNFLRVTSATSSTLGADVQDYIVTLPRMLVSNIGGGGFPATFGLALDNGSGSPVMSLANGFAIYNAADVLLTTPLLLADITLVDPLLVIGESGLVEGTTGVVGLSNIHTIGAGGALPTLVEFATSGAVGGADFTARINSAGIDIASNINAGILTEGSANGSVQTIPEPTTLSLMALGALMWTRRSRKAL
jgi:hypothetical protein